jgi:hypothetical protein
MKEENKKLATPFHKMSMNDKRKKKILHRTILMTQKRTNYVSHLI